LWLAVGRQRSADFRSGAFLLESQHLPGRRPALRGSGGCATRLPGRGEPRNVVTKYTKEELAGERQDVGFEPPEGGTPNGAGGQPDLAGRWCPAAGGASAYASLQRDKAAPPYRSCQTLRALAVSASPRSNGRRARHRKRTIVIEDRRTSRLRYTSPRQGTRTIEAAVIQADRRVRRNAETRRTQRGGAATKTECSRPRLQQRAAGGRLVNNPAHPGLRMLLRPGTGALRPILRRM
jgi:hypothetical protein